MIAPCLQILFISCAAGLLVTLIEWIFVYSTDSYKRLKSDIEATTRKLDKQKQVSGKGSDKRDKKADRYEEAVKQLQTQMTMFRMKSMFATAVTMMLLFSVLNSMFDGRPVARLPFEPFGLIQGITHRNLPGTDFHDCSMVFLYLLCSMSIRSNLQKFLGFAPPVGPGQGLFMSPDGGRA